MARSTSLTLKLKQISTSIPIGRRGRQSCFATSGSGFFAECARSGRFLDVRCTGQAHWTIANRRADQMEAADCERPTIDLRIEPEDARLGFQTTELAVFNFEQRDLSKRSHRKFE